jgi:hypothetical protein
LLLLRLLLLLLLLSSQVAEERHSAAIAALKSGWAAELKRQQAGWESGAAAKQEAWRAAKTAEIKEQTVKVCAVTQLLLRLLGCSGPNTQTFLLWVTCSCLLPLWSGVQSCSLRCLLLPSGLGSDGSTQKP